MTWDAKFISKLESRKWNIYENELINYNINSNDPTEGHNQLETRIIELILVNYFGKFTIQLHEKELDY